MVSSGKGFVTGERIIRRLVRFRCLGFGGFLGLGSDGHRVLGPLHGLDALLFFRQGSNFDCWGLLDRQHLGETGQFTFGLTPTALGLGDTFRDRENIVIPISGFSLLALEIHLCPELARLAILMAPLVGIGGCGFGCG